MPEQDTAPGARSASIARWAAAARPALAATPEAGPQQTWTVMQAIAQACGDPAMRLVGRIGHALLITDSRNTPAMTGWDAIPQPGGPTSGAYRDIPHRLALVEAMADTLDALAVQPTLVRGDGIRLTDALRAYVQGATAALAGEPRPGRSNAGSAPGRVLGSPGLDAAANPAAPTPPPPTYWLARRSPRSSKAGSTMLGT
jgi:hypothetical protein